MSTKPSPSIIEAMPGMGMAAQNVARAKQSVPAHDFDEAMSLMEVGRWQAAFDRLAQLADRGHPQAARVALLFVRRGTAMFGGAFPATPTQREAWQAISDWD